MATAGMEGSKVTDKGVLVVHRPRGDELYEITKIPAPTMSLVQCEKADILKGLSLDSVLTELNRASDLLFLAYMGVVGTGELHARISTRQMELSILCTECLTTMTVLEEGSRNVLIRLTEAYKYLLKAKEVRAMKQLSRCAENAQSMATACEKLAHGFGKLSSDTKEDAATAAVALGNQVTKVNNLKNLRQQMEANKKKQEQNRELLNESITDLHNQISEETAREDVAAQRSFVLNLVGGIAGSLGSGLEAGLSAVKATVQPFTVNLQQPGPRGPSGGKDVSEDRGQQKVKEDAKKALEDARSAEEEARVKERRVHESLLDAEAVKDSKLKRLDAAKAADKAEAGYEEKVKNAQAELDESSEKVAKLRVDHVEAEKELTRARKIGSDAEVAVKAAAASLEHVAESAGKMSQAEADRAKESGSYRRELLKQRRQQQELRREAVGLLAELTSLLSSNTEETRVEDSAQSALEIAGWALSNVFVALSNAKLFWDRMTSFCERLAKPDVLERIKDEYDDGGSPEERIQAYMSEDFVKAAMTYVSKWAALTVVCGEYVQASDHARKSVLGHIKAAPSMKEAREQIKPLQERLLGEMQADAGVLAVQIEDLKAKEAEIMKEDAIVKEDEIVISVQQISPA